MIRSLLISTLLFGLMTLCPAQNVEIVGKAVGLEGKMLYLKTQHALNNVVVDSVRVGKEGRFAFPNVAGLRSGYYGLYATGGFSADLILNGERVEVNYDEEVEVNSGEALLEAELKGIIGGFEQEMDTIWARFSGTSQFDPQYKAKTQAITRQIKGVFTKQNEAIRAFKSKYPDTFVGSVTADFALQAQLTEASPYFKDFDNDNAFLHQHYFDELPFDQPLILRTPLLQAMIMEFLQQYSDKTIEGFQESVKILLEQAAPHAEVQKTIAKMLLEIFGKRGPQEVYLYITDNWLSHCESEATDLDYLQKAKLIRSLSPGNPAPNISLHKIGGEEIHPSDYKGKHLLLFFWASWCPHCTKEIPELLSLYHEYRNIGQGFEILAISIDKDANQWLQAIQQYQLDWINICEFRGWDSPAAQSYYVRQTPTNYLIAPNGTLQAKDLTLQGLRDALK